MSGISRSPRPLCPSSKINGGDNSSQTSLDLNSDLSGGGSAVYVQSNANQNAKRQIEQPRVYREKHLDDDDEVLVGKFEYKEFVWWSDYLKDELPLLYQHFLEKLGVEESDYGFELQGFMCFRHKEDKNRRCDVDHIYLPQVWCGKYHPYASVKHKRRACMRTLERLEHLERKTKRSKNRFDYLVKLDLTLPKCISFEWCNKEAQIRIRKALQRFLELLHDGLFPKKESQFGVICNHHYWRTRRPLEPHRHLHLTIPNVCYNKSENMFYRFSPYIKEKLVKRCWKKALLEYSLWHEECIEKEDVKKDEEEEKLPDCRVGYIKFSERNKVINRLSYVCRKPVEDMIEYLRAEDLEFFEDSKEFAEFLINYTPRVVNLGFLTNLKRFGYNSNKPTTMICPICGGEMVAWQNEHGIIHSLDRPPPNAPKVLRDREGIWYVLSE